MEATADVCDAGVRVDNTAEAKRREKRMRKADKKRKRLSLPQRHCEGQNSYKTMVNRRRVFNHASVLQASKDRRRNFKAELKKRGLENTPDALHLRYFSAEDLGAKLAMAIPSKEKLGDLVAAANHELTYTIERGINEPSLDMKDACMTLKQLFLFICDKGWSQDTRKKFWQRNIELAVRTGAGLFVHEVFAGDDGLAAEALEWLKQCEVAPEVSGSMVSTCMDIVRIRTKGVEYNAKLPECRKLVTERAEDSESEDGDEAIWSAQDCKVFSVEDSVRSLVDLSPSRDTPELQHLKRLEIYPMSWDGGMGFSEADTYLKKVSNCEDVVAARRWRSGANISFSDVELVIDGSIDCSRVGVQSIAFATDAVVYTIVAPSVHMSRSEENMYFPLIHGFGSVEMKVGDGHLPVRPARSPAMEEFNLLEDLEDGPVQISSDGIISCERHAMTLLPTGKAGASSGLQPGRTGIDADATMPPSAPTPAVAPYGNDGGMSPSPAPRRGNGDGHVDTAGPAEKDSYSTGASDIAAAAAAAATTAVTASPFTDDDDDGGGRSDDGHSSGANGKPITDEDNGVRNDERHSSGGGGGGGIDDHSSGGGSESNNSGDGESGSTGDDYLRGLFPDNLKPHSGRTLKPGETMTGALLSASGRSAAYLDRKTGSVVAATTHVVSGTDFPEILTADVLRPNLRKFARLQQLQSKIEEDTLEAVKKGVAKKTLKELAHRCWILIKGAPGPGRQGARAAARRRGGHDHLRQGDPACREHYLCPGSAVIHDRQWSPASRGGRFGPEGGTAVTADLPKGSRRSGRKRRRFGTPGTHAQQQAVGTRAERQMQRDMFMKMEAAEYDHQQTTARAEAKDIKGTQWVKSKGVPRDVIDFCAELGLWATTSQLQKREDWFLKHVEDKDLTDEHAESAAIPVDNCDKDITVSETAGEGCHFATITGTITTRAREVGKLEDESKLRPRRDLTLTDVTNGREWEADAGNGRFDAFKENIIPDERAEAKGGYMFIQKGSTTKHSDMKASVVRAVEAWRASRGGRGPAPVVMVGDEQTYRFLFHLATQAPDEWIAPIFYITGKDRYQFLVADHIAEVARWWESDKMVMAELFSVALGEDAWARMALDEREEVANGMKRAPEVEKEVEALRRTPLFDNGIAKDQVVALDGRPVSQKEGEEILRAPQDVEQKYHDVVLHKIDKSKHGVTKKRVFTIPPKNKSLMPTRRKGRSSALKDNIGNAYAGGVEVKAALLNAFAALQGAQGAKHANKAAGPSKWLHENTGTIRYTPFYEPDAHGVDLPVSIHQGVSPGYLEAGWVGVIKYCVSEVFSHWMIREGLLLVSYDFSGLVPVIKAREQSGRAAAVAGRQQSAVDAQRTPCTPPFDKSSSTEIPAKQFQSNLRANHKEARDGIAEEVAVESLGGEVWDGDNKPKATMAFYGVGGGPALGGSSASAGGVGTADGDPLLHFRDAYGGVQRRRGPDIGEAELSLVRFIVRAKRYWGKEFKRWLITSVDTDLPMWEAALKRVRAEGVFVKSIFVEKDAVWGVDIDDWVKLLTTIFYLNQAARAFMAQVATGAIADGSGSGVRGVADVDDHDDDDHSDDDSDDSDDDSDLDGSLCSDIDEATVWFLVCLSRFSVADASDAEADTYLKKVSNCEDVVAARRWRSGANISFSDVELVIDGSIDCSRVGVQSIAFATDAVVYSEGPLNTRDVVWLVVGDHQVTIVAPSVHMSRSEENKYFPLIHGFGSVEMKVGDGHLPVRPARSPAMEEFNLLEDLEDGPVQISSDGIISCERHAMYAAATEDSPADGEAGASTDLRPGRTGIDADATMPPSAPTPAVAPDDNDGGMSPSPSSHRGNGDGHVDTAEPAEKDSYSTGASDIGSNGGSGQGQPDATCANASATSGGGGSSGNDGGNGKPITDDDDGGGPSDDGHSSGGDGKPITDDGDGKPTTDEDDRGPNDDVHFSSGDGKPITDDCGDGKPTTDSNDGGPNDDGHLNSGDGEPITDDDDGGGPRDDGHSSGGDGKSTTDDDDVNGRNDEGHFSGGGKPITDDGGGGGRSDDGHSSGGGGGGTDDHFSGGGSDSNNFGGGESGSTGDDYPRGLFPDNLEPHSGRTLKPGETMTGALLSASGRSAAYVDHKTGSVVVATTHVVSGTDIPEILTADVLRPNLRKFARLQQLQRQNEEDTLEAVKKGVAKRTLKELAHRCWFLIKGGLLDRGAKEHVRRHAGEADMTISDKGILRVSISGRTVLSKDVLWGGATFWAVFRRRDSSWELVVEDDGMMTALRQGQVVNRFTEL
eukprot:g10492.t1